MNIWDWLAVVLFGLCWLGYGPLLAFIARRSGSLNADMAHVRHAWMTAMTRREIRLIDAQLMGHTINSASFFASTNLLLIAAVAGVLFGGEAALRGFAAVGAENVPIRLLEAKLALVLICLARGLMDFIWSIRQMNYTIALIGAAPEIEGREREAFGAATGRVLNPALNSFSQGVRGYYFAIAAAAWLFGPVWLAIGVVGVFCLLIWRQEASPAAIAIREARRLIVD
ncbi:DUF599 domain-containing protein [Brevundimonas sp. S30B]|uniref:DUF599 domain-containing protein n=1 Tax=unclassified Brevundimonas TaxID=2622653 RepID=UPI001071E77D|nr:MULTISPECIES: DUF599 domain-containing protein [unclassified Brevundimonas]QBX36501.1 DUF599 domain-containing protein [Brevundimonas sp. MF30-B]TFW00753.1 DUF599 domain-containing protein [Brevundimonas sp. S30B]